MQISGFFQSVAGPIITAAYTVPNAVIHPSPGRDLAAGARGTDLVNLVQPGTQYGDRMNQLDLRVTKLFRVGSARRLELMADFYNALNASPALTLNATYGPDWLKPTSTLQARFAKPRRPIHFLARPARRAVPAPGP